MTNLWQDLRYAGRESWTLRQHPSLDGESGTAVRRRRNANITENRIEKGQKERRNYSGAPEAISWETC
jgi:hypothetical protein